MKPRKNRTRDKKRKRDEEDPLNDNYQRKRQKVEQKTEEIQAVLDRFDENSDGSENDDEYLEFNNIGDALAPKDKELLRQDPFNQNFAATTWTNEFTLLKANSEFNKWRNCTNGHSGVFPPEIYSLIASYCDPVTLFTLRYVSKPMNALVVQSDQVWRKHFYSRRWKLRQDLENGFCEVDPLDSDKSEWVNVIPDNEVDWFGEYRRNHINSYFIRTLVSEITTKLQKIVDEYGAVKHDRETPMFFGSGLTDAEIDEQNDPNLPITNDMRELLKCCNGQRFKLKERWGFTPFDLPPLNISIGPYIEEGTTLARLENYCNSDESSEDSDEAYCLSYPGDTQQNPKDELKQLDVDSDGDDYEPSQLSYDSDEEVQMEIEEANKRYDRLAERSVFGYHQRMPVLNDGVNFGEEQENHYYDTNTGALIVHEVGWDDFVVFPSIVDYLQDISDCLDSPLAPLWLELEDYALVKWEQTDDLGDFIDKIEDAEFGLGLKRWADIVQEAGQEYMIDFFFPPRAIKLLAAAAQDTTIKVFQRAQELETRKELQLSTFQRAAKEVSRDTQINE